jgi:hypothetical protein
LVGLQLREAGAASDITGIVVSITNIVRDAVEVLPHASVNVHVSVNVPPHDANEPVIVPVILPLMLQPLEAPLL